MRRLVRVAKAGTWPTGRAEGSLTLAFEERHRRRIRLTTDAGEAVLLDPAERCSARRWRRSRVRAGWLACRARRA
jgi:urease accessory protein